MEITNKKISISGHIFNIKLYKKKLGYYKHIYFNINHYENKIGYYKHIYFYIILHENKLGYHKHRYFFLSYFKLFYE